MCKIAVEDEVKNIIGRSAYDLQRSDRCCECRMYVSKELNAIENAWQMLRERLDAFLPSCLESRIDFIILLTRMPFAGSTPIGMGIVER